MIMLAVFVAIASTVMEVKMVQSIPKLDYWYTHGLGPIPGAWVNNLASLLLSAICGLAFGAQGVIIMIGGMLSILMSNVYFSTKSVANKNGYTYSGIKTNTSKKWEESQQWYTTNRIHFVNLGKTVMSIIKIITAPIRAIIAVNNAAHSGKQAMKNQYASVHNFTTAKTSSWRSHKAA